MPSLHNCKAIRYRFNWMGWCRLGVYSVPMSGIRSARPVAQLVERWTPGSESPGSRRSGARYMKLLTGMARLVGATAAS